MNRRSLFRSLGLAAVVAGVSTLPKAPQPAIPESLPAFTKAKSEPLPELSWLNNPKTPFMPYWSVLPPNNAIWQVPAPTPYAPWTTTGTNQITFTNSANLVITGGAGPKHTSGYVQATRFVPPTGDEAFADIPSYIGSFDDLSVFSTKDADGPLFTVVYPPDTARPLASEIIETDRFFVHPLGGIGVELSNGVVLRRSEGSDHWQPV